MHLCPGLPSQCCRRHREARLAIVAFSLLSILTAGLTQAHEPTVLPIKLDGKTKILNVVSRQGHLSFSPSVVDFGDVVMGSSAGTTFSVTNTSNRHIEVTITRPSGVTLAPDSLSLAPGAVSLPVNATWTPSQAGALSDHLSFAVSHEGAGPVFDEEVSLSGNAGTAAALRFDVMTFGENDVSGTYFGMASVADSGPDKAPMFEMKITNVGGLPARDLEVVVEGPGGALASMGVCHWGLDEAGICVAERIGMQGDGTPMLDAVSRFDDLAPGQSVTTQWRIDPANAGLISKHFDVRFHTGSDPAFRSRTFTVAGEIVGSSLPGGGFLRAGIGGKATEGFGAPVDPLKDDVLGALRPVSFDARTVFSLGEVDTVDLRTGNLTLVVPIGGPQTVRGSLAYELKAVLNSQMWHRRTLTEFTRPTPQDDPVARPTNAEYPDPAFNLGSGWSLHLGRLLPPFVFDGIGIDPLCPDDPLAFEKVVETGPRFVYIDPNGTQHAFWRELHGNDIQTNDPADVETYSEKEVLYARDGSYLRLVLDPDDPSRRWVEEPSGIRRLFVKQQDPLQPTLPDRWLLQSIEDPYGNSVAITYSPTTWTIADEQGDAGAAWRTTTIHFADWAGRTGRDPMVVSRVELPGFDGGPLRTYTFAYTDVVLGRPPRSGFHTGLPPRCDTIDATDLPVGLPRLDSITLPDTSAFTFVYESTIEDPQRLRSATLPTGATVEYAYADVWDSPPDCENGGLTAQVAGISRRTVRGVGNAVLEDRVYLRETLRAADVPSTICQSFNTNDFSSTKAPFSEQTVAVWSAQENGLSSVSVHHFNIYPFDDRCSKIDNNGIEHVADTTLCTKPPGDPFWRLDSGRSHIERNLNISHSRDADPLDSSLRLSEELFSCDVGLDGIVVPRDESVSGSTVGDDISALTDHASCEIKQTTYAEYEVSRAGFNCSRSSPSCLIDSRLVAERTQYRTANPDDIERWVKTSKSDFDGLGNYRRTTTRSTFQSTALNGRLEQTTFQNWNPGAGMLRLNPDHTVRDNITLPTNWLLNLWDYQWVDEGGAKRGGEAHHDPEFGHLTHQRTWFKTGLTTDPSRIATNRDAKDIVVAHEVNAFGELETQRFFGADTLNVPVGDNWFNNTALSEANQDYAVDLTYAFGHPATQRVAGDSVYDPNRTIDQSTGWPRTETRNSGEVLTFDYDDMGRVTWVSSPLTASRNVDYQQQTDGRWNLTATVYPKGTTNASVSPSPIRIYDAAYDALGRLRSETLPLFDDNPSGTRETVVRTVTYHPSGTVKSVTPLDPGNPTQLAYDYRGRIDTITNPDGSKLARDYDGDRKTFLIACVKTGIASTSGICTGTGFEKTETVIERDWKGRIVSIETPLHDPDSNLPFETTFTYDPLDNRTSARRTHKEGGNTFTQIRSWAYDGRGFLTREIIPERVADTRFSNFTTRGLPRNKDESGRTSTLVYDRLGRLRALVQGGLSLKRFTYCDPEAAVDPPGPAGPLCDTAGSENGQLIRAVRNNYRDATESGLKIGGIPTAATWLVTSTFGHDEVGRQASRSTEVFGVPGLADNPVPPSGILTTFTQGWNYDDLGNVTTLTYPTCNTPSPDCSLALARSVDFTYGQGFYLTEVTEGTMGASLTYHRSGLVNTVTHKGGGGTDTYGVAGGMPRIASIDLGAGATAGGQRFNLGTVTYDGAGNITGVGADVFTYDSNSRLTAATIQGTARTYTYDNFDNLRNHHTGIPGLDTGVVDPTNNQLTGPGWSYDSFGNLLSGIGVELVYDGLDKLAGLHEPSGVSLLGIYDHDDLRVLTWRENDPQNPNFTWTLRDGLRVIRDYIGLGSAIEIQKDYIYAGTRQISSADMITGSVRHYHEDQVGNARLITGANPRRVHYEPFGEALGGTASGERATGFQGHENDGLTTYMRGRTYLPFGHRFLQVDPARDSGSWSQYAFVGNNPMSSIDPDGLALLGDQKLIDRAKRLAERNSELAQTLDAFRGPDRDLTFEQVKSLKREDGLELDGRFGATVKPIEFDEALDALFDQDQAAALAAVEELRFLTKIEAQNDATITIVKGAGVDVLRHELGHASQFLSDPIAWVQQSLESSKLTGEDYENSASEEFAKEFAKRTAKKDTKKKKKKEKKEQ